MGTFCQPGGDGWPIPSSSLARPFVPARQGGAPNSRGLEAGTQRNGNLADISAPHPEAVTTATVDRGTQRRRRVRLGRTRAGASLRTALALPSPQRRQSIQLCTAANTLTALGIRVAVTAPGAPWPRAGRVVVADSAGWLADLALVTAALTGSSAPAAPTVCPVAVRYRAGDRYLAPEEVPRTVADAVAMHALVVEVRCLPAA